MSFPILDLRGARPMPQFREKLPDEFIGDYIYVKVAFQVAWAKEELARLEKLRGETAAS